MSIKFDRWTATLNFDEGNEVSNGTGHIQGGTPRNMTPEQLEKYFAAKAGPKFNLASFGILINQNEITVNNNRPLISTAKFPLENQAAPEEQDEDDPEVPKKEKVEDGAIIGFFQDEVGLYVIDTNMKAHIRDQLSRLGVFKQTKGKNEFQLAVPIRPHRLRFTREDGSIIKEPDGIDLSIAHLNGAEGRRSALKIAEYLEKPLLTFSMYFLKAGDQKIKPQMVKNAFLLGQLNGFGANRTMGQGRYTLKKFEKVDEVELDMGGHLPE